MSELNGILNILKPPGLTSFQVVQQLRKILEQKKIGHTGTLDPLAVGVLPVCLGKGTKIIPFLPEEKKQYVFEMELGVRTDTLDREGRVISRDDGWQKISPDEIKRIIAGFTGKLSQVPPMYSAVKKNGQPLYQLAREGQEVDRETRKGEIYSRKIYTVDPPVIRLQLECSRGTYIRSLVRDIGEELGCGAVLNFLIRTRSGPFHLDSSQPLHRITADSSPRAEMLLPVSAPLNLPELKIRQEAFKYAVNGASLYAHNFADFHLTAADLDKKFVIKGPEEEFIAVSRVVRDDDGRICLHPERVFYQQN